MEKSRMQRLEMIGKLKLYHDKDLFRALHDLTLLHNQLLENRLAFKMLGLKPTVDELKFINAKTDIISELLNRGHTATEINDVVMNIRE